VKQFDLKTLKEVHLYPGLSDWAFALDYEADWRCVPGFVAAAESTRLHG